MLIGGTAAPAVRKVDPDVAHKRATLSSMLGAVERSDRISDDERNAFRQQIRLIENKYLARGATAELDAMVADMAAKLNGLLTRTPGEAVAPADDDVERYAKNTSLNYEPLFNRPSPGMAGMPPLYRDRPPETVERFDRAVVTEPLSNRSLAKTAAMPTADVTRQQYARATEAKRREAAVRADVAASSSSHTSAPTGDVAKYAAINRGYHLTGDRYTAEQIAAADRQRFGYASTRQRVDADVPAAAAPVPELPDDVRQQRDAAKRQAVLSGRIAEPVVQRYSRQAAGEPYHRQGRPERVRGDSICTCSQCRRDEPCECR
jgi:hypothetical protein